MTRSLASDHVTKMRRGQSTQRAFCSYVFRSRLRHYFFVSLTRWHRCHPESGLQAPDHAHVAESARWLQDCQRLLQGRTAQGGSPMQRSRSLNLGSERSGSYMKPDFSSLSPYDRR